MKVELIPVIEIISDYGELKSPDKGPYWEYADAWENFYRLANKSAGFSDELNSYLKGSALYKISDISENNLIKLVLDRTQNMRANNNDRELCPPFAGGYVLRLDGDDKIFPQCCSDLGNIENWQSLVTEQKDTYDQGHPAPIISFMDDVIIFDLTTSETDYEKFVPKPMETLIKVDRTLLSHAIAEVQKELEEFSNKLHKINIGQNLNIENIEKLLIYGC